MKNAKHYAWLLASGFLFLVSPLLYAQRQLIRPPVSLSLDKSLPQAGQQEQVLQTLRGKAADGKVQVIGFDPAALQQDRLSLSLPDGENVEALLDERDLRAADDFTWHGHLPGRAGSVMLLFREGQLAGRLVTGDKTYAISPLARETSLVYQSQPFQQPRDGQPRQESPLPDGRELSPIGAHGSQVRLLLAYTPEAEKSILALGYPNVGFYLQQAVSEVNQVFLRRGLEHRATLGLALALSYQESGSPELDLQRFESASDGFMEEIHGLRQQYHADVSVLLLHRPPTGAGQTGFRSGTATASCVVPQAEVLGNADFAREIGLLHVRNARTLALSAGAQGVSAAVPAQLNLGSSARLGARQAAYVRATTEINLEPGFEADENSDLLLEVGPDAGLTGISPAPEITETELLPDILVPEMSLQVGPVPTVRNLEVEVNLPKGAQADIALYNMQGLRVQEIYQGKVEHDRFSADLARLPAGVYLVSCRVLGQVITRKIVLTK